ncbi:MAG: P1 family peptidase [Solirubrobacterales bacterium]
MSGASKPGNPRREAPAGSGLGGGGGLPADFLVGHWTDAEAETGCTVVLPPRGTRCGVDVRGGGPGSRETEIVGPLSNPREATAVLLTGGSAYGLAAADGVARWCERQGRGYRTPGGLVPLVPAAVIYDLMAGDGSVRPGPEQGMAACEAAVGGRPKTGRVGAAAGAAVGKVLGREMASPGGVGFASARTGGGHIVAAISAVNATGDVLAADGSVLAGVRDPDGRTSSRIVADGIVEPGGGRPGGGDDELQATTLVCLCTDAALDKVEASKLARMASAGIARAVDPVFTPFDGDVVFALASGEPAAGHDPATLMQVGTLAATVTAEAIRDAVS